MFVVQLLIAFLVLIIVPTFVGNIWASPDRKGARLSFRLVSGQLTLWAGFQLFGVICVFLNKSFHTVCLSYTVFQAGMIVLALGSYMNRKNKQSIRKKEIEPRQKLSVMEWLGWAVFAVLVCFLFYSNITMTYADGDNAFYVATANLTETSNTMYRILPYTGMATELDIRHALAPFPVWIAYLSRITGIRVAIMAHVVFPVTLLVYFFELVYLIAVTILADKKNYIPMFMISMALFVLFGDYSIYTVENFLVARSSQGKAVLGSIVIPFLIWVVWRLLEFLQEKKPIPVAYYGLLQVTMLAGCLCSALSCFLLCLFLGLVSICVFFTYRTFKPILWFVYSAVAPVVFAGIYFFS